MFSRAWRRAGQLADNRRQQHPNPVSHEGDQGQKNNKPKEWFRMHVADLCANCRRILAPAQGETGWWADASEKPDVPILPGRRIHAAGSCWPLCGIYLIRGFIFTDRGVPTRDGSIRPEPKSNCAWRKFLACPSVRDTAVRWCASASIRPGVPLLGAQSVCHCLELNVCTVRYCFPQLQAVRARTRSTSQPPELRRGVARPPVTVFHALPHCV